MRKNWINSDKATVFRILKQISPRNVQQVMEEFENTRKLGRKSNTPQESEAAPKSSLIDNKEKTKTTNQPLNKQHDIQASPCESKSEPIWSQVVSNVDEDQSASPSNRSKKIEVLLVVVVVVC